MPASWVSGKLTWYAEVHGVHRTAAVALTLSRSSPYPDFAVVGGQDVLLVFRAVHPNLEDAIRVGVSATTPGDVLSYLLIGVIPEALKSSREGLTIVGIVVEVAFVDHLLRMILGCLGEYLADA